MRRVIGIVIHRTVGEVVIWDEGSDQTRGPGRYDPDGAGGLGNGLRSAGKLQKKGNKPGAAHAYNVRALRDQEMDISRHAAQAYEQFVAQWETRPKVRGRSRPAGL